MARDEAPRNVKLEDVPLGPAPIERFASLVGEERMERARRAAESARERLEGRAVWNVNSTAMGGGVAEMLRPLLCYARGAGIDARWLVIQGEPEFFKITKALHHALHGSGSNELNFGREERTLYERTLQENAVELCARVGPGDVVILHDPQTAGLAPHLLEEDVVVLWRCHIGSDRPSGRARTAWEFLHSYLADVPRYVFTRDAFVPEAYDHGKSVVIQPSIDAFSAKNQELPEETVHGILVHTGLVEGPPPTGDDRSFRRSDDSPGRVERRADVVRLGRAPTWRQPLVVQVSRWDALKDPVGVMRGFAKLVDGGAPHHAHLVLAGPNVHAVADDPEGDLVFKETLDAWRGLPHAVRDSITLASIPTSDVEENAAIVNALQRHATVIVQKSLQEGFGLTVTEGMWKGRPVLASRVGGIQDQIEHEQNGLLVDPADIDGFARSLRRLLEDRDLRERLGEAGRESVREHFLGLRHLMEYAELLSELDARRR